jgi:hypothetical protein
MELRQSSSLYFRHCLRYAFLGHNMEIGRRLIGPSAVISPENKVIDVDVHGLIRRLLLFDKYVLMSIRLQEFPLMAKHLGYEGLRTLLRARIIEVRCECLQLISMGQSGLFGLPALPLFFYRFDWVNASNRKDYIHECLKQMHGSECLERKQVSKLKQAIAAAIRPLSFRDLQDQVIPAFHNEILHNPRLLNDAIKISLQAHTGLTDAPFSVSIHQESPEIFRAESDLQRQAKISDSDAHKIIERAMLAIAAVTQAIAEMKFYAAISGFRDNELPLFRHKLDFLSDLASAEKKERSFQRVIDLADVPDFTSATEVDVDKLLKIRDSAEAREFRDWLGTIGDARDKEIHDRIASFKAKAGLAVGSERGKALRFLVTTSLGMIPHTAAPGIALGGFDQFLLDKLLPRSGIAAFVNELYPSIFEHK